MSPVYVYRCACGYQFERVRPMASPPEEECPQCGDMARKMMGSPGRPVVKDGTPIHHGRAE